jgi:ParB-like chromosome segregation protein Spo0J
MAMKINAGEDMKRGDVYLVDPYQIQVREDLRGRECPPMAAIVSLAASLYDHGQRQAVECRLLPDRRLQLVSGYTRNAAARLIREGFEDAEGNYRQNPAFLLKCLIVDRNDREAFIGNIIENAHRNATSPMDDARNQRKLREECGEDDGSIARLYRWTTAKVEQYRQLLSLAPEVQTLVHTRQLKVSQALELATQSEAEQVAVITHLVETGQKVTAQAIRDEVREQVNTANANKKDRILRDAHSAADVPKSEDLALKAPDAPKDNNTAPKPKPRNLKELRTFLETVPMEPEQIDFAQSLLAYLDGTLDDGGLAGAFDTFGGIQNAPVTNGKKK